MADVVLVFPAFSDQVDRDDTNLRPPLGVLMLASVLLENGVSVRVIDQRVQVDWRDVLRAELESAPLCVGVSSMSGDQIKFALRTSKFVKEHSGIPVVWGGVHPILEPSSTIQHELVDISCTGEGENVVLPLLEVFKGRQVLENVKGIAFKKNGEAFFTPPADKVDLDALPFVPFHLVDMDKYRCSNRFFGFKGDLIIPLETSRGCSHRCTFCRESVRRFAWRAMRAERVVEHIEHVIVQYKINTFTFNDDNFFVDNRRAEKFVSLIEEEGVDIEWYTNVRPDYILRRGPAWLQRLEKAGAKCLTLGAESGNDDILERMGKGITAEGILRANRDLAKTSILTQYVSIPGLPYDTLDTVKQTYELAIRLMVENPSADHSFAKLIPTPATVILEACVQKGYEKPETLEEWSDIFDFRLKKKSPWIDEDVDAWMHTHQYLEGWKSLRAKYGPAGRLIFGLLASLFLWRLRQNFYGILLEPKAELALRGAKRLLKGIRKLLPVSSTSS
ncbi:MAG: B12-binding domain-containing radical SAM protein [Chloroflexi bacterium]|nr:B12-binding domain-containing radical SAM protein [Chloroflexota bacterium]